MLTEAQESTDRQLNKIMKTIHEKFKKVIETIEKNQTEILELKKTVTTQKKISSELQLNLDQAEEGISEHKDRSFEIIQSEEQKEKIDKM